MISALFAPLSSIVVPHTSPGSYLVEVTVWTGWKTIHSDRQQQAAASSDPPPPSTASLGSDLWASSSSSSVWEEFLFSSFLVAMSLGCCPPALKKTLPALLLSSLLPALPHISSSEPFCLKHLAPTGSSTYRRFRRDLTLLFADWGWNNPKLCSQQGPDMFEQLEVHFMLIPQTLLLGSLFMKHKSDRIRVFRVFAPLLKHQNIISHTFFATRTLK